MRCAVAVFAIGIFTLAFFNPAFCAEEKKPGLEDALIGSTLKTLAKLFISAQSKDRLIEKLNNMDEEKFQRRYARIYQVIKDAPPVLSRYGFKQEMAKSAVINKIKAMEKKEMSGLIDAIPDAVIASQFKLYLNEKKQPLVKSNPVEQITGFWNKLIANAGLNK